MKNYIFAGALSPDQKKGLPLCKIITPYPELDRMISSVLEDVVTVTTDGDASIVIADTGDGRLAIRSAENSFVKFISRPIRPEELVLAVMEVPMGVGNPDSSPIPVDRLKNRIIYGGTEIRLSPTEMRLFIALRDAEDFADAESLSLAVWGVSDPNLTRVYMTYLRKKLSTIPGLVIHSVRGRGYRLILNNSRGRISPPVKG